MGRGRPMALWPLDGAEGVEWTRLQGPAGQIVLACADGRSNNGRRVAGKLNGGEMAVPIPDQRLDQPRIAPV